MTEAVTIALDAMGGEHAPGMVVQGANIARKRHPNVRYAFFGDEGRLRQLLDRAPALKAVSTVHHTSEAVSDETKPSVALRTGRQSSMRLAIDAVHRGEASGVVSAGNTGALMAMSKVVLRMLPGIDRPAIASYFPSERGETVMLDLGANVESDAENLVQFAIMGSVFARAVLGVETPSVGILNVGAEEMKGHDDVREAAAILRRPEAPVNFYGFVEGDDITAGTVDVVVTDGFTGNVALKTAEGTARLYTNFLRGAFRSSLFARFGYLLAAHALRKVRVRTDPRRYNGAMFLGLNGVVIKSHGSTDRVGFANAIGVAVDMVQDRFNERIKDELARLAPARTNPRAAAV